MDQCGESFLGSIPSATVEQTDLHHRRLSRVGMGYIMHDMCSTGKSLPNTWRIESMANNEYQCQTIWTHLLFKPACDIFNPCHIIYTI